MKPFRNSGWEHYDKIHDIFPSGGATGGKAFNAATSSVPPKAADHDDESTVRN